MEPFKWADLVSLTNLIVAAVAAIIALLSPRIAWQLTRRSQQEDQRRQTKLNIFGMLMQNRHIPQSREAVSGLNLIDVAFHDDGNVRMLWREYHAMISNTGFTQSPVGWELIRQKLTELLAEMAQALNYSVDRFDIERVYYPTWLMEDETLRTRERAVRLAALSGAPPQPSGTPPQQPPAPPQSGNPVPGAPSPDGAPSSSQVQAPQGAIYLMNYSGVQGAQGYGLLFMGNERHAGGVRRGVGHLPGMHRARRHGRCERLDF
jgi:hypothetical protein